MGYNIHKKASFGVYSGHMSIIANICRNLMLTYIDNYYYL